MYRETQLLTVHLREFSQIGYTHIATTQMEIIDHFLQNIPSCPYPVSTDGSPSPERITFLISVSKIHFSGPELHINGILESLTSLAQHKCFLFV